METRNDEMALLDQVLRAPDQEAEGEWGILVLQQQLPQPQGRKGAAEGLGVRAWHLVFLVFAFVGGSIFPRQCGRALRSNDPSSAKKMSDNVIRLHCINNNSQAKEDSCMNFQ